ncbi:MAG: MBL fold metallo-hydrolase [Bacilli bacterium]|nr:MBL fold metallo-hydrolase [Bacilli bacterium]
MEPTNIEFGGNGAFVKDNENLIIIDAPEEATKKLNDAKAFDNINNIYIIITHSHYDHVAGLGILIWYSNFYLKIKPNIIYSKNRFKRTLNKLLKITGVHDNLFTFIKDNEVNLSFKVDILPTTHSKGLDCFGIMFTDNTGKYYYTGDTNDINFVRKLNDEKEVKKIYCEVATETYDVHIKYDDIKDLDKEKFVLMHFDKIELYNKVKKDGFNVGK